MASAACFAADTGRLKTEIDPSNAGVFVDGMYVGPAKSLAGQGYELPIGEHELWITAPRYEDIQRELNVKLGETVTVRQSMKALPAPEPKPPFGTLRTEHADPFAAVFVKYKYMGYVEEFNSSSRGLLLSPGTYEVKIAPRTGAPVTKTVTIEADKTVLVK